MYISPYYPHLSLILSILAYIALCLFYGKFGFYWYKGSLWKSLLAGFLGNAVYMLILRLVLSQSIPFLYSIEKALSFF